MLEIDTGDGCGVGKIITGAVCIRQTPTPPSPGNHPPPPHTHFRVRHWVVQQWGGCDFQQHGG